MNYKTHKTWKLRLCSLAVFLVMVLFSHTHSNTFNIFSPTFKPELHWIQQPANNWLHVQFHVYLHFNRWITLQQRPFILHNSVVVWTFTTIQDHPVDRWLQHKILSCLAHWRLIKFFFFKLKEKKKKREAWSFIKGNSAIIYIKHIFLGCYWFTTVQLPEKEDKHYSELSSNLPKSHRKTMQLNCLSMSASVSWVCCPPNLVQDEKEKLFKS